MNMNERRVSHNVSSFYTYCFTDQHPPSYFIIMIKYQTTCTLCAINYVYSHTLDTRIIQKLNSDAFLHSRSCSTIAQVINIENEMIMSKVGSTYGLSDGKMMSDRFLWNGQ
jgi:hypothetical protein